MKNLTKDIVNAYEAAKADAEAAYDVYRNADSAAVYQVHYATIDTANDAVDAAYDAYCANVAYVAAKVAYYKAKFAYDGVKFAYDSINFKKLIS